MFEVWTKPEHIVKWWGPKGFTNTIHKMDVKVDGKWSFIMHGPDGVDYPSLVVYSEIIKPEKLAYTVGSEDEPGQFNAVVTFEEMPGNETFLTMKSIFRTAAERDFVIKQVNAIEGGNQTVDKLGHYLALLT